MDKMYVKERLHHNAKRNVKIKFGPDEAVHLMNRKGEKLRSISVKGIENLVCEVTQDRGKKPMMLIGVNNDHDLVLDFSNVNERKKMLTKLETFLQSYKKRLETVPTFRDEMLANAETKERRKARRSCRVTRRGWRRCRPSVTRCWPTPRRRRGGRRDVPAELQEEAGDGADLP